MKPLTVWVESRVFKVAFPLIFFYPANSIIVRLLFCVVFKQQDLYWQHFSLQLTQLSLISMHYFSSYWKRLSRIWRILQIEEVVCDWVQTEQIGRWYCRQFSKTDFFAFYVHNYHSKMAQLLSVFICVINAEYSLLTENKLSWGNTRSILVILIPQKVALCVM